MRVPFKDPRIAPASQVPERLAAALSGRYTIERELGAGGMATVYLAHDLRHDRRVAVKVLRPELAAVIGADRFLAEIRTTANLQHPHILPLFDSGEADSFLYYVMPFIDGESLRDRLHREKQLPIADAIRIASEVASALHYAHRHGVIHRDIKPENVLLQDGRAMVADFGIALAASRAGGSRMTETGMSLGTPQYMSPEQAMGEREITARSDVYALGAMTYEMLVGDPPFTGSTAQAIVAKVVTGAPTPPSHLRSTIPPAVEDAVLTALAKLPADRFASAAEYSDALAARPGERSTVRMRSYAAAPGPWRRISGALAALLLAALALAGWAITRPPAAARPAVFDAVLPANAAISFAATTAASSYGFPLRNLSVSADGSFAVYAAMQGDSTMLWRRSLRDASARAIAGTRGGTVPRVSPDGARVAYLVGGRAMIVPIDGGEPRQLFEGRGPYFFEWISQDTLLLSDLDGTRLSRLDPEGGPARSTMGMRTGFASWSPGDGRLVSSLNGTASVGDPATGQRQPIRSAGPGGAPGAITAGSDFRVIDGRYLVFVSDGDLRAAAYDPGRQLAGRSVALVEGIRREANGIAQYEVSAGGDLVYAPGADAAAGHLVRASPGRAPERLPVDSAEFQRFDVSPDRRWLTAVVLTPRGQELRIYDLRDGQRTDWLRAEVIRHALWSPDGERIIIGIRDSTRWSILLGPPGAERLDTVLTAVTGGAQYDPMSYDADGFVVAQDLASFTAVRFDPTVRPVRLDTIDTGTRFPTISPDGRHIARTDEGGRIFVTSYPGRGRQWQVTADGSEPLWMSPAELLFRSGVAWYLARLDPATGEPRGVPALWARDPRFSDTPGWSNRPSRDGGIIYVQGPEEVSSTYLRVIPNWVETMKRAVDAANR